MASEKWTQKKALRKASIVTVSVNGPDVSLESKITKREARQFLKYPEQFVFNYWPVDQYLNISGSDGSAVTIFYNTFCDSYHMDGTRDPERYQIFKSS